MKPPSKELEQKLRQIMTEEGFDPREFDFFNQIVDEGLWEIGHKEKDVISFRFYEAEERYEIKHSPPMPTCQRSDINYKEFIHEYLHWIEEIKSLPREE